LLVYLFLLLVRGVVVILLIHGFEDDLAALIRLSLIAE
jgi:hypothetical protein